MTARKMKRSRHLFIIRPEIIQLADQEEVRATLRDLKEMGLYHLPYNEDVYLQMNSKDFDMSATSDKMVYGPLNGDIEKTKAFLYRDGRAVDLVKEVPGGKSLWMIVSILRDLLIVVLATKNAEKTTTKDKLAHLGIGKSKGRFHYTTTISLPSILPDDPTNPPKGGTKAPHLRRGHIRHQKFGKDNSQEKLIWIAPIFVNADPDFVNQRRAYNILGH